MGEPIEGVRFVATHPVHVPHPAIVEQGLRACVVPECGMPAATAMAALVPVPMCYLHGDRFARVWVAEPRLKSYVYVAKKPGEVHPVLVKIGRTRNLPQRMEQLQLIPIFAAEEDVDAAEADWHRTFSVHRRHGEWFEFVDPIRTYMRSIGMLAPDSETGWLAEAIAEPERAQRAHDELRRQECAERRHTVRHDRIESDNIDDMIKISIPASSPS